MMPSFRNAPLVGISKADLEESCKLNVNIADKIDLTYLCIAVARTEWSFIWRRKPSQLNCPLATNEIFNILLVYLGNKKQTIYITSNSVKSLSYAQHAAMNSFVHCSDRIQISIKRSKVKNFTISGINTSVTLKFSIQLLPYHLNSAVDHPVQKLIEIVFVVLVLRQIR